MRVSVVLVLLVVGILVAAASARHVGHKLQKLECVRRARVFLCVHHVISNFDVMHVTVAVHTPRARGALCATPDVPLTASLARRARRLVSMRCATASSATSRASPM